MGLGWTNVTGVHVERVIDSEVACGEEKSMKLKLREGEPEKS